MNEGTDKENPKVKMYDKSIENLEQIISQTDKE